jgi:type I restriction enzyme, S subunit
MTAVPAGWDAISLGNLLGIKYGKALDPGLRDPEGPVPVVGSAGRMTGTHEPLIKEPVVLIGRKGNVGAVQLESHGCWPIDTTYYAPIPERLDPRFLLHQLIALDMKKLDSSTTTPSLRRQDLEAQTLAVPPLDEQRRIVDILEDHLSRLDAADAYLVAAQRREAVLYNQLLSAELDAVRLRVVALGDLLTIGLSNGKSVPTQQGGFPVLRLTALRDGRIDLSERKDGAWSEEEARRFLVQKGDFLISRGNGSLRLVGRGGLVSDVPDPVAFPDTLIRARPDVNKINAQFLAFVWNAPTVRRQIETSAKTTAGIYKVNQKDLNAVQIPLPAIEDQRRVVAAVSESRAALASLADGIAQGRNRAVALRRSLLTAAFSGSLTGTSDLSEVEELLSA